MKKPIMTLPCNMRLEDLTTQQTGFHCVSCDKVLTDFRGKTNEETIRTIQTNPGKVCGIFHPSQFDFKVSHISFPTLQTSVGLSLLGILGFLGPVVSSCETSGNQSHSIKQKAFNKLQFPMHVSGVLNDENSNQPLPNAVIHLQQNGKTIQTVYSDAHGNFEFVLQKGDLIRETFDLIFTEKGHVSDTTHNYPLSAGTSGEKIHLTLKAETGICTKTIENTLCPAPGEVLIEGITVPEPAPASVQITGFIKPAVLPEETTTLGKPEFALLSDTIRKQHQLFRKRKK